MRRPTVFLIGELVRPDAAATGQLVQNSRKTWVRGKNSGAGASNVSSSDKRSAVSGRRQGADARPRVAVHRGCGVRWLSPFSQESELPTSPCALGPTVTGRRSRPPCKRSTAEPSCP